MSYDPNSANYVEFSVMAEPNRKTRMLKFFIIFGATVIFTVSLYLVLTIAKLLVSALFVEMVLLALAMVALWKYTSVEYDCIIASGEMQMSIIYGGKKRKEIFTQKLSSFETIANMDYGTPNNDNYTHIYKCVSSDSAANIVYATFKNDKGEKCIVYFQPIKKAYSILKFYNMSAYKIR